MTDVPRVLVSAPGKLILFGEHAVVYTSPALAAAVSSLRTSVEIAPGARDGVEVHLPRSVLPREADACLFSLSWDVVLSARAFAPTGPTVEEAALSAIRAGLSEFHDFVASILLPIAYLLSSVLPEEFISARPSLKVAVRSHGLPAGAGLGSSAAFSVALAGAVCSLAHLLRADATAAAVLEQQRRPPLRVPLQTEASASSAVPEAETLAHTPPPELAEELNAWAFVAETIFHGSPSGLDNTMSTRGGALWFSRHPPAQRQLSNPRHLRVLIVNTHVPRSTKALVGGLRERRERCADVYDPLIDCVAAIVRRASAYIERGASETPGTAAADAAAEDRPLEALMRLNQAVLNALGVGHAALDEVCRVAGEHGFAAKLTGAGGGGCAFVLLGEGEGADAARCVALEAALRERLPESTCHEAELGGVGVAIHCAAR